MIVDTWIICSDKFSKPFHKPQFGWLYLIYPCCKVYPNDNQYDQNRKSTDKFLDLFNCFLASFKISFHFYTSVIFSIPVMKKALLRFHTEFLQRQVPGCFLFLLFLEPHILHMTVHFDALSLEQGLNRDNPFR